MWAQERVAETVHNLSAGGPGQIRSADERQVCVFCHAPHNTAGMRPLWNRDLPVSSYRIYQSSTLDAKPGQPTGSSKLCLSCHDGTIALGSVLSRSDRIRMLGGDFIPSGLTNLGTDLSDDHPISFEYTSGLAASDRQLAGPATLRREVRLDSKGQLQCTSCHNPHSNVNSDFLVVSGARGELCISCHTMQGWPYCTHATARATVAGSQRADWPYSTVAENACQSCHRPHAAGGRERLLIFEKEEDNCLSCHDGQVAGSNILAEIDKISAHDPRRYFEVHDPAEPLRGDPVHVECADCYKCHQRSGILSDRSFSAHRLHIVDQRTPCSACHDPHGISVTRSFGSDHTHLINFDLSIVQEYPATHRLTFRDLGTFAGSCTLLCHGSPHNDRQYSPQSI